MVIVLIAIFIAASGYYFYKFQKIKNNPELVKQEEIKAITDKVGKLMELPEGEELTLATVVEKEKLMGQNFFRNSENGDKILIYAKAKKAILFRPSTGKIIEAAPLILNDNVKKEEAVEEVQEKIKVAIYNGTAVAGLANEMEAKIIGIENISVISKTNASKKDYSKTLVVDLTGKNATLASEIAGKVNGETGELPEGETRPEAGILIIAGK